MRTIRSVRHVGSQNGHGRGLRRSSQADQRERRGIDGHDSSGGNRGWPRHRAYVGVHKRTLQSVRRVGSQDGHGRALRRSSQGDQRKRHGSNGCYSSIRRRPRDREEVGEVGVHKRTLRSARRVSSPGGHGRGLRRSSQADQKKWHRIDGNDSSGYNRVRLLERKGGKLTKGAALRKGGKLTKEAALRKGAALSNSQFGVPGRTIRSGRGLKTLDADGVRWRRDSQVGQHKGYGLDGQLTITTSTSARRASLNGRCSGWPKRSGGSIGR